MAFTKTTTPTALAGILVTSTSLGSTPSENVTGNSSGKIYQVKIDNSVNPDTTLYIKIADAASASSATTAANWVFPVRGGQKVSCIMDTGAAYTAGISMWCTTRPGTGSQGEPPNPPAVSLLAT